MSEASFTCRIEVLVCQVRHACQGLPTPGLDNNHHTIAQLRYFVCILDCDFHYQCVACGLYRKSIMVLKCEGRHCSTSVLSVFVETCFVLWLGLEL